MTRVFLGDAVYWRRGWWVVRARMVRKQHLQEALKMAKCVDACAVERVERTWCFAGEGAGLGCVD